MSGRLDGDDVVFDGNPAPAPVPRRWLEDLGETSRALAARYGTPPLSIVLDGRQRISVRAGRLVGVVQRGPLCVEVLPKIDRGAKGNVDETEASTAGRHDLMRLLDLAQMLKLPPIEAGRLSSRASSFLELLILIYASELWSVLRQEIPRDYRREEGESRFARGRLLLERQARQLPHRRHLLHCSYDLFDEDTLLNRILRRAALEMARVASRVATRRMLEWCIFGLDETSDIPVSPDDCDRVVFTARNDHLRPHLSLARQFLAARSHQLAAGPSDGFVFLVAMEDVFEAVVARLIERYGRQASPGLRAVATQKPIGHLVVGPREGHRQIADLVLRRVGEAGDVEQCVLDTKYKPWPQGGPDAADLRQVVVYAQLATALATEQGVPAPCRRAALVYPKPNGFEPARSAETMYWEGIQFVCAPFDLRRAVEGKCKEAVAGLLEHIAPT